jgi:hypothetical protein
VNPKARDLFFSPDESEDVTAGQYAMCLRAQANPQRHAVAYRVKLEESVGEEIQKLLKESKFIEALEYMKANTDELMLGTQHTTKKAAEKNWKMIPNPALDPYHDDDDRS